MTKRTRSNEYCQSGQFRRKVEDALQAIKTFLNETRAIKCAADVDHSYEDKFGLAEFLSNAGWVATINALERLGLDGDKLLKLMELSEGGKRSVTLRLSVEETCDFSSEQTVEMESPHVYVSGTETIDAMLDRDDAGASPTKRMRRFDSARGGVLTKVAEYHWKFSVRYSLFVFVGSDPDRLARRIGLRGRLSSRTIVTMGNKVSPRPGRVVRMPMDASIGWLLKNLSSVDNSDGKRLLCTFSIDRSLDTCRTPRRNDDVDSAVHFFRDFWAWCHIAHGYFVFDLAFMASCDKIGGSSLPKAPKGIELIDTKGIFIPVLPLFRESDPSDIALKEVNLLTESSPSPKCIAFMSHRVFGKGAPLLHANDISLFFEEQCRSMDNRVEALRDVFPSDTSENSVFSITEATIAILALHAGEVCDYFVEGIDHVEDMLRKQLVSAIGKQLQPNDFLEYMAFHNKELFRPEFTPQPFCYTIGRHGHSPEGTLSIVERLLWGFGEEHTIEAVTRKFKGVSPISCPINATTSVEFTGQRYLHAWVTHDFEKARHNSYRQVELAARARQFSSFLLLIGKVSGPNAFDPKHAIIIQNKDKLLIPLLLEPLPTPKEFRDAIKSLSPEQKRFATAFRNMQLESSVFGVCVVQLKPQLEVLLGLPTDALTKEIRLTQDLLELFTKYHVPPDLLTYDGSERATLSEKVAVVKDYVDKIREMIDEARAKDLEAAGEDADMRFERTSSTGSLDPSMAGSVLSPPRSSSKYLRVAEAPSLPKIFSHAAESPLSPTIPMRFSHVAESPLSPTSSRQYSPVAGSPSLASLSDDDDLTGLLQVASSKSDTRTPLREHLVWLQKMNSFSTSCAATSSLSALAAPALSLPSISNSAPFGAHTQVHHRSSAKESRIDTPARGETVDFTLIPKQLDSYFEALNNDSALRLATIETGPSWEKVSQGIIPMKSHREFIRDAQRNSEKQRAFDLLDALSRSGAIPIENADLHVMVAATHCFDSSLVDTVVQDGVNPIEKFERSMLAVASTIHGQPTAQLLKDQDQLTRIMKFFPELFSATGDEDSS